MDINIQYDPKWTKIGSILVLLGPKLNQKLIRIMILVNCLHEDGHRNQMMAISWLKTLFLASENQLFHTFDFFSFLTKNFGLLPELQIWQLTT